MPCFSFVLLPRISQAIDSKHFRLLQRQGMDSWLLPSAVFLAILAVTDGMKSGLGGVCHPSDLKGLRSFREHIQVDTSGRLAKWNGIKCCEWEGISCDDSTGQVIKILLPGLISTDVVLLQSWMKGVLSPSITLLRSLQVIDLGGLIGLSGSIPSSIGIHLPNLKKLHLYGNKITGHIPDSIGWLQNLEELDLSNNLLSGKIPASICNLTAISTLYLDTNNLEGPIPASISELPSLGYLRLQNNRLTGSIPQTFGDIASLLRVSLANNKLTGAIPPSIGNLSALTELYLDGNLLSGQIPSSVGHLSGLLVLNISHNAIQGALPREMSSLQNLQILDMSFNRLKISSIPEWFPQLLSLSKIYMAGCSIKGELPRLLRMMHSPIQELDLSANYLTGSLPSWLGSLTQLYLLNLSRNSLVSVIPETFTSLSSLGILDLHSNKMTGSIRHVLGSPTYIDLSGNRFSNGTNGIGAGANCGIHYLNISHNSLRGWLPNSIGRCTSMEILDASNNELGSNLPVRLSNISALEMLKLQRNRFTGNIPKVYLKLRKLRDLDLSDNLLAGEIPSGKPLSGFPGSSFSGNQGLCGRPLPPCKL